MAMHRLKLGALASKWNVGDIYTGHHEPSVPHLAEYQLYPHQTSDNKRQHIKIVRLQAPRSWSASILDHPGSTYNDNVGLQQGTHLCWGYKVLMVSD